MQKIEKKNIKWLWLTRKTMMRKRMATKARILKSVGFLRFRIIDGSACECKWQKSIKSNYQFNVNQNLTCIFSFNKLARELMLVIECAVLFTLWESYSAFAMILPSFKRIAGKGAIEFRRFVRNLVLKETEGKKRNFNKIKLSDVASLFKMLVILEDDKSEIWQSKWQSRGFSSLQ